MEKNVKFRKNVKFGNSFGHFGEKNWKFGENLEIGNKLELWKLLELLAKA